MAGDRGEIIDLTEQFNNGGKPPERTRTFAYLGTLNTNVYFRPGDPEEAKYKQWLIGKAGRIFSENNIRSCLRFNGKPFTPKISIKTTLERGTKRKQLHLHSNVKFTMPVSGDKIWIDYAKFNEKVQEILEMGGARVFWVPYFDNSANVEAYILKDQPY